MKTPREVRMRKLIVLSALALACGDGDGGSSSGLSGTVAGRPLAVTEVRAIRAGTGTTPCSLPVPGGGGATVDFGVSALAIEIASYANACADYATSQCTLHANAQSVTILLAKLDPTGAAPALAPGNYTVQSSPSVAIPDGSGHLTVAFAQALGTDAAPACAGIPSPAVQGGTLRLDAVSGTPVTGHLELTFQDGSAVCGDFSAEVCPGTAPDICQIAQAQALCTPPPVCVP
jgi:hypothetical protein